MVSPDNTTHLYHYIKCALPCCHAYLAFAGELGFTYNFFGLSVILNIPIFITSHNPIRKLLLFIAFMPHF